LFDPKAVSELGITQNINYLKMAAFHGWIQILDLYKNNNLITKNQRSEIACMATCNNRIDVLEWVKNAWTTKNSLSSPSHIYNASRWGKVDVLEWLKNNEPLGLLHVKSDNINDINNTLDLVSRYGHVKVLEWWKNAGLPINSELNNLGLVENQTA